MANNPMMGTARVIALMNCILLVLTWNNRDVPIGIDEADYAQDIAIDIVTFCDASPD